jgi:mannose-6-phosphate isomerase-like protein (cupin superfamily)
MRPPLILSTALVFVAAVSAPVVFGADVRPAAAATYVASSEIDATIVRMGPEPVGDRVVRVVTVGQEYNIGVSAVRRTTVDGRTPRDAIVHDKVTEIYHVIEGSGVLITGGTLDDPKRLPVDSAVVRDIVGPSSIGSGIRDGVRQHVSPGDVVVIPHGTPHGFVEIEGTRIVYAVIRVDADRVLAVPGDSTGRSAVRD